MRREALYVLTIAIGLFVSARYQEWPVNIWCLGVFSYIFWKTNRKERIEMIAVLGFATPMELFFSEVWLIYEYQRGLMPLFVPVGHYFLLILDAELQTIFPRSYRCHLFSFLFHWLFLERLRVRIPLPFF